jgi:autotransporter-associated beta strand protein
VKSAPGTAVLSGQNSYAGGTEVWSDVLLAASAGALPRGGDVTIGPGATLVLPSNVVFGQGALAVGRVSPEGGDVAVKANAAPSSVVPVSPEVASAAPAPALRASSAQAPPAVAPVAAASTVAAVAVRTDELGPRAAAHAIRAHGAAIAGHKAAPPLLEASWLALLEQAVRQRRSSAKSGPACAALDQVLARYGLTASDERNR